jgi:hypothetical protein
MLKMWAHVRNAPGSRIEEMHSSAVSEVTVLLEAAKVPRNGVDEAIVRSSIACRLEDLG